MLDAMIIDAWTAFEVLTEDIFEIFHQLYPTAVPDASDADKVGFRSRGRIRKSYEKFIKDLNINTALKSTEIDAIALVRNVLVHCGGIADSEFRTGVSVTPLLVHYASLNNGDMIHIDGDVLRPIIDNYVTNTCLFISAADDKIQSGTI